MSLAVVVLVTAAAVVVWQLSLLAPTWWAPPDASDPRVTEAAQQIEYSLIEQAHMVRTDDETWSIRIHDRHVNAWLASRLGAWLAHAQALDWPGGFGRPQMRSEPGWVTVAIELDGPERRRFVAVRLIPTITAGELRVTVDRVSLGRLTIPGKPVGDVAAWLNEAAPGGFLDDPEVQTATDWLLQGRAIDPTVPLADGRAVRLVGIRCEEGAVVLRCRTISRSETADKSASQTKRQD
ncbi:MAG: hypothetical protein V3T84_07270 [Phycisphaerales bacterium]